MLIVDAYNVLHLPEAAARDLDVAALCRSIGASRYAGGRVVVICDGAPGSGPEARERASGAGIDVVFVGAGRSADDEIEARLHRHGGAGVTVVSDDRRLRRAAGRAKARTLASGAFLAQILLDQARRPTRQRPAFTKDLPLDRYSIAHWLSEFGLPASDVLAPRPNAPKSGTRRARPSPAAETQQRAGQASLPEPPPATITPRETSSRTEEAAEGLARLEALREDPIIRDALEAWRGRLSLEDLDMQRWLDGPAGRGPAG
ncbi:MAG: NYN domain-containing protein [Phycisphaerales bacterium]|nr:NYN domain-containing protein [Phycisphaerales bacterium]